MQVNSLTNDGVSTCDDMGQIIGWITDTLQDPKDSRLCHYTIKLICHGLAEATMK